MNSKKIVLAIIIFTTITSTSNLPFAYADDWTKVTTITGSADQTTNTFSITGQEWRLQWNYTPDPNFPSLTFFGVLVYPEGEGASFIDSFYVNGSTQTSGTEYVNGSTGNYHMEILDANIPSYTIIVQQYGGTIASPSDVNFNLGNVTSVLLVVLVIAVFAVVAVAVLLRRRINRRSTQLSKSPPPEEQQTKDNG